MKHKPSVWVLTAADAAEWDRASIEGGVPSRQLMETAGRAVADVLLTRYRAECQRGVVVAVGHGNNGGDGWVTARYLFQAGAMVTVAEYDRDRTPDCEANRELALAAGVERADDNAWTQAALIVDAVLGTGVTGAPRGDAGALVERIAASDAVVVSVDGPSGLDLTSGQTESGIRAETSVTFGSVKRGHLLARETCGTIQVADIGFLASAQSDDWDRLVTTGWAHAHRPRFKVNAHKGTRGRVTIIGGNDGMAGAVHHAGRGAFAAGAGLVRIVASERSAAALQEQFPDAMVTRTAFAPTLEDDVAEAVQWADSIILGPGLGREDGVQEFIKAVLSETDGPALVDADALAFGLDPVADAPGPVVLTPHAGEFQKLFPDQNESDAFDRVRAAAATLPSGTTLLAKGVPTLVGDGTLPFLHVVATGNPGLATGGSGDVLSGIVGALLAGGMEPRAAACLGAWTLGRAAEFAADSVSVVSMRPGDVVRAISDVWLEIDYPPDEGWPSMVTLDTPRTA